MATINTYLNFNGNTEEAFNFYKAAFGGEFAVVMRFGDTPGCEEMPATDKNKIMHIALPIGGNMLMGTDVPETMEQVKNGTSVSISVNTDSEQQTRDLFEKLSAGGDVKMPLDNMFWGALYGMFTDKFGIQWMLNYEYEK
ncbi:MULTISPECIES: VOC family protein [Flavobacterium]|jgi:PhnB protein|uniref:PhnB protein n=1 Tax=Flavobacterium lindanitolerans TaxID=428988 RepID=A0A497U1M7_9FLAO|nr:MULTISPECIES: VOC family protein [Flavobacterium]PZQ78153.1 MAG: VOC family protein [Flavobacterium johnsoniae]KQS47844.1 glyoxalase [Flavobacterium sp. Leaf359]MBL7868565.1 VOC family protein [Flavobacterium lindanitolerans]MDQ7961877.1 VOC family protein [Flavobacterium lindanitolerans]OJX54020.1 MAG: VOC family protein [Flavobacterium sp. 38-13]